MGPGAPEEGQCASPGLEGSVLHGGPREACLMARRHDPLSLHENPK